MTTRTRYKTALLQCWGRAKELRQQYYAGYARAKAGQGLTWMGSAWAFDAVPAGLGDDVYCITGEPYGAACACDKPLSETFMKAATDFGFSRDLCAYMRNYWGSVLTGIYAFGGKFPRPDFAWTQHICCSHGKWYQNAAALEHGIPAYVVDVGAGPCPPFAPELYPHRIDYVAGQLMDGIDWLTRITGREFNDERFITAAWNDIETTALWSEVCLLNRAVPAPLDEKTLYSLYVLAALGKSDPEVTAFYRELLDEVRDRVDAGIAAAANEEKRVMSDCQPPWSALDLYRVMQSWGVVSIGSLYTFALEGAWIFDTESYDFLPRPMPDTRPSSRSACCRLLAQWHLSKPLYQHFYSPEYKTVMMDAIAKRWSVDGIILHFNRGCAGLSLGIAENRLGLIQRGNKVMTYHGNMGDGTEFDRYAAESRLVDFMAGLGASPPNE